MTDPRVALDTLAEGAQADLERALRGASLCAVSRDPAAGSGSVKFLEGRWYALQDIRRRAVGQPDLSLAEVAQAVAADYTARTPAGPAWTEYAAGAASAVREVTELASLPT